MQDIIAADEFFTDFDNILRSLKSSFCCEMKAEVAYTKKCGG